MGPRNGAPHKNGNIQNNNRFSYLNPRTAIILTNDGLSSVVGTTGALTKPQIN